MASSDQPKLKPFPVFRTDEEAEHFIDTADLSEYDFSQFKPARFELRKKDARVNMRLPTPLLERVKAVAEKENVPYQRLIRDLIEQGLARKDRRAS